jgi:hypothetical protein
VSIDQTWLDRKAAWWAKLDRAEVPAGAFGNQGRAAERLTRKSSHTEPIDTPDRVAYRMHVRHQVPVATTSFSGPDASDSSARGGEVKLPTAAPGKTRGGFPKIFGNRLC